MDQSGEYRIAADREAVWSGLNDPDVLAQCIEGCQSLQQLETARIEANRQVRYLSLGVSPVPPDEATYPRAFENTILAFLVFAGIYLMISLTASITGDSAVQTPPSTSWLPALVFGWV